MSCSNYCGETPFLYRIFIEDPKLFLQNLSYSISTFKLKPYFKAVFWDKVTCTQTGAQPGFC